MSGNSSGSSDDEDEQTILDEQLISVMRSGITEDEKMDEVKKLLGKGASINAKGSNGDTPLHVAVRKKEKKVVAFLVTEGAKADIVNGKHQSPLDIANSSKSPVAEIVAVLQSIDNPITETVKQKMVEFIQYFVSEFETKLWLYHMASLGLEHKSGKMSDRLSKPMGQVLGALFGGGLGFAASYPAVGAKCGAAAGGWLAKEVGDFFGNKYHMDKVAKISGLTKKFLDNGAEFRIKLVESGFDLFQSFEMQFMRVTESDGSTYALHKLAKDAVNRAIEYYSKAGESCIADAVILGESKIENVVGVPINTKKLKSPGFEIIYEFGTKHETWKTASLFDKAGVVVDKLNSIFYFKKRDKSNKIMKYGYRRLLIKEIWENIQDRYVEDDTTADLSEFSFQYITNPASREAVTRTILEKINSSDKKLEEDRIKEVIVTNAEQILREFRRYKQQNSLENDELKKRFANFEVFLKEYAVVSGKPETTIRTDILFGLRKPICSFIGRKDELAKLHEALQSDRGEAVICGFGGTGKSELVVKYIHERMNMSEYDNVIWVNASSINSIKDSYIKLLSEELNLSTRGKDGELLCIESMVKNVYKQLENTKSIFIFDDAASLSEIENVCLPLCLPVHSRKPHIVITSSDLEWESARRKLNVVILNNFTSEESYQFITENISFNILTDKDAFDLSHKLDNFPLALQQAVNYINFMDEECQERNLKFEISDYLKEYEKNPEKLLKVKLNSTATTSTIFKVLEIAIVKIKENKEIGILALKLLNMLSYFSRSELPESYFLEELAQGDRELLMSVTGMLKKFAILSVNNGFLRVNGLVQQAVQIMLHEKEIEEQILDGVLRLLKNQVRDLKSLHSCKQHLNVAWSRGRIYNNLIESYIANDTDTSYFNFLIESCDYVVVKAIFDYLEQNHSEKLDLIIKTENKNTGTVLHSAATNGDVQVVQLFINKCKNENYRKGNGWTPLLLAAKYGNFDVVKLMIDRNINIDVKTKFKFTPLHLAAQNGYLDVVRLLLQCKKFISGRKKIIDLRINAKTMFGSTPLHLAAENGNVDVGEILLSEGAEINASNNDLFRALHLAVLTKNIEFVKLLLNDKNVDVDAQTSQRNTPIHLAVESGDVKIVEMLLDENCNLEIANENGMTVTALANSSAKLEIKTLLSQFTRNYEIENFNDLVTYNRRQGTSGISGQLYEIELAMILLLEGLMGISKKTISGFYLAANMVEAGDFDDVVFRYKYRNLENVEKSKIIFLQAKHRENTQEKLTKEKLLSLSEKGDFNLKKYFGSYRKIIKSFDDMKMHQLFENKCGNLNCELIIFTNAVLRSSKNDKWFKKICLPEDGVLSFAQRDFMYRILFEANKNELVKVLEYASDCKILSKKIVHSITENEIIDFDKGIFKAYHAALANEVFQKINSEEGKFKESFLNNSINNIFYKSFMEELWTNDNFKFKSADEMKSTLRQLIIQLPEYFGSYKEKDAKYDLPTDVVHEDEIESFVKQFILLVNQPDEKRLAQIIKEKIMLAFTVEENDVDSIYADVFNKIQKWWKDDRFCLTENNKFFQDSIKISIWFNVKKPVDLFTGRDHELECLHNLINQNPERVTVISQMTSISGLGGIGKTELAREYIDRHSKDYDSNIVWINAETESSLVESFHKLAEQKLKISTKNIDGKELDIQVIVGKVYNFFAKRSSLFIFDNADKNELFTKCLPLRCLAPKSKKPHILITSRYREWEKGIKVLDLHELKLEEAIQFVKKGLHILDDSCDHEIIELVKKLQCFPLAIQQAIAYIEDQRVTDPYQIADYLQEYERKTAELLQSKIFQGIDNDYTETVFTTWRITIDKINDNKADGKLAIEILNIIAYMSSENINRNIFFDLPDFNQEQIKSAVRLLVKYSMLNGEQNQRVLNIHRLVQEVIRWEIMERGIEENQLEKVLSLMKNKLETTNIVHTISAWNYSVKFNKLVKLFSNLPPSIVYELDSSVRYKEANMFGYQVLQLFNNAIGSQHIDTLNTKHNLAGVLKNQGKYDEALHILQEVYDDKCVVLGSSDNSALNTKNVMATVLDKQGKFEAASQAYQSILEIRGNTLGQDHLDTLNTRHNNAIVLRNQGKYDDALEHFNYVLSKREEILGADHVDTLTTKHNIGITLVLQGKYEESLQKYKEVYDRRKYILGPNHPDTIRSKENMSEVFVYQGKLDDALQVLQEVLGENEEIFGSDHSDTLLTKTNIAYVLEKQGKYEEAIKIYNLVLDTLSREDNLGPDHPYTLHIINNIGYALDKHGKYDAALEVYEEAFDKRTKVLGPDHPSTLVTSNNIAGVHCSQGKYELSLLAYQELLGKRVIVLGPNHPNTLFTKSCLAGVLNKLERFDESMKMYQEVLEIENSALGPNHVSTLITKNNIGQVLVSQSKYTEAFQVYKEVFKKRKEILGNDHPETLNTQHNMACVLGKQGDISKALEMFQEVLEKRNIILGSDHPDTLCTGHNFALFLEKRGEFESALQTYQQVFEKRKAILGDDHPDTVITKNCIDAIANR